jgi:hypothetical protein
MLAISLATNICPNLTPKVPEQPKAGDNYTEFGHLADADALRLPYAAL